MQGWKKKMLLAGVMVGVNAFCLPVNADAVQPDAGTISGQPVPQVNQKQRKTSHRHLW